MRTGAVHQLQGRSNQNEQEIDNDVHMDTTNRPIWLKLLKITSFWSNPIRSENKLIRDGQFHADHYSECCPRLNSLGCYLYLGGKKINSDSSTANQTVQSSTPTPPPPTPPANPLHFLTQFGSSIMEDGRPLIKWESITHICSLSTDLWKLFDFILWGGRIPRGRDRERRGEKRGKKGRKIIKCAAGHSWEMHSAKIQVFTTASLNAAGCRQEVKSRVKREKQKISVPPLLVTTTAKSAKTRLSEKHVSSSSY